MALSWLIILQKWPIFSGVIYEVHVLKGALTSKSYKIFPTISSVVGDFRGSYVILGLGSLGK